MPQGYVRGRPDAEWWMQQVTAGIAFRKKFALEPRWDDWRSYYRGRWRAGVMPKNLFFMMIRTIVPRIYFRNPSVSVTPRRSGYKHMAMAQILERVDNKMIRQMRVKNQIKRMIQNSFMFGTGFGKLGYGAEFSPSPDDVGEAPFTGPRRNEYRDGIIPNMPWFLSVHPKSVIVPSESPDWEGCRWWAHWVKRPVADVSEDPRLSNVKHLTDSRPEFNIQTPTPGIMRPTPMIDLVEVRDKMTRKVFIMAPYHNEKKILYFEDDEMLGDWGSPMYPLVFNEDDEVFWGVPESVILEPYQLEVNEIRTQAMKHRRISIVKLLYQDQGIKPDQLEKLTSEDVLAGVAVSDINAVKPMEIGKIPESLSVAEQGVMQDVRETVGFGRNQFGEFKPGSGDTTATEAEIVRMASEIRVDERRDMVADVLVRMISDMHRIIFNEWKGEQVVQVVGPLGVPMWVEFKPEMLAHGRYEVAVDPDTSIPETKGFREQKALKMYEVLKTNPLIDPMKLTNYLMHEMHGVQFDDLIRGIPPGLGVSERPFSLEQYAGILQGVGNRLGQGAVQQRQLPQRGSGGGGGGE